MARPPRSSAARTWSQSGSRPGRSVLERPAEAAQPVVDVDVTGLDQTIGVEHQPRTVGHLEGDRLERHPADAQRCTRRLGQQLGRTVRPLQHRRRVSRRRVGQRPGHRVEDRVDAGGQLDLVGALGEVVEVAEQVLGHRVEHGEHPDRRAQLAHRGGGAQPASHHVTDDQRDPAAGQRDHVEPVTADTQVPAAGEVALGRVDAGHPRLRARQQGALQRDGCGARLVVQPDVVQRQRRPGRDLLGQGHVGRRVRRSARLAGQPDDAEHATPGPQRHEQLAQADGVGALAAGRPGPQRAGCGTARRVGHPLVGAQRCFVVVPVDSGHPEQHRAVDHRTALRVEQALDQVDVHPSARTGTTLRATPRATARRSRVSESRELASTSSRSRASAGTSALVSATSASWRTRAPARETPGRVSSGRWCG